MIYILIVMWAGATQTSSGGKSAVAVEFNDLASCKAAAAEIRRQQDFRSIAPILLCAQKGRATATTTGGLSHASNN